MTLQRVRFTAPPSINPKPEMFKCFSQRGLVRQMLYAAEGTQLGAPKIAKLKLKLDCEPDKIFSILIESF